MFTVIDPPVLGISKSVALTNDPAKPGDAITYTIVISNSGPSDATNVRITDTLPVGVIGSNVDVTQTIAAGESYTLTITGTVATEVVAGITITNHAYYSHTSGSGEASAVYDPTALSDLPALGLQAVISGEPSTLFTPRPGFSTRSPASACRVETQDFASLRPRHLHNMGRTTKLYSMSTLRRNLPLATLIVSLWPPWA